MQAAMANAECLSPRSGGRTSARCGGERRGRAQYVPLPLEGRVRQGVGVLPRALSGRRVPPPLIPPRKREGDDGAARHVPLPLAGRVRQGVGVLPPALSGWLVPPPLIPPLKGEGDAGAVRHIPLPLEGRVAAAGWGLPQALSGRRVPPPPTPPLKGEGGAAAAGWGMRQCVELVAGPATLDPSRQGGGRRWSRARPVFRSVKKEHRPC